MIACQSRGNPPAPKCATWHPPGGLFPIAASNLIRGDRHGPHYSPGLVTRGAGCCEMWWLRPEGPRGRGLGVRRSELTFVATDHIVRPRLRRHPGNPRVNPSSGFRMRKVEILMRRASLLPAPGSLRPAPRVGGRNLQAAIFNLESLRSAATPGTLFPS